MVEVQLTDDEALVAAGAASARFTDSEDWTYYRPEAFRFRNTVGTFGECAVGKLYRLPWHPVVPRGEPDLRCGELRLQVRATHHQKGKLYVYKGNLPGDVYVLCTVDVFGQLVKVRGWLYGHEAMEWPLTPGWGGSRKPVWQVPQPHLRQEQYLRELVEANR